jgi:hypothetical protein
MPEVVQPLGTTAGDFPGLNLMGEEVMMQLGAFCSEAFA